MSFEGICIHCNGAKKQPAILNRLGSKEVCSFCNGTGKQVYSTDKSDAERQKIADRMEIWYAERLRRYEETI